MDIVARAHLFALCAWAALVLAELVVEVSARDDDDQVFQASAESFPASDAPSFTPVVGTAAPQRHI